MDKTAPQSSEGPASSSHNAIQDRLFRTMVVAIVLAVIASLSFVAWRVTAGLLLGGLLSLLNHRWLGRSVSAAFAVALEGAKPQITLAHYVLRYVVIGVSVFIAYNLNVISMPATFIGLSSFVVALFIEAFREFYITIIQREETN